MDTTNPWQGIYISAYNSELKFIEGHCRLHLPLKDWPYIFEHEKPDSVLDQVRPEISFMEDDGAYAERIPITSGLHAFLNKQEGEDPYALVINMAIRFPEGTLRVTVLTSKQYPFNGVLGRFVAIIEE